MALKSFFGMVAAGAILVATAGAAVAQPQPRAIEAKAGAPFRHAHTKIELPPSVAGIARTAVAELEADELDTIVDYSAPDLNSDYTFYIYRNVAGALPVWFDRAAWMIEHRDALGTATRHGAAAAFVPPGRDEAAGLLATYDLSGKDFRSTGVALLPFGEWYVKLRASSKTLGAPELEARMKAALAELGWPKTMPPAPVAVPVERCATALAARDEAKLIEAGGDRAGASTLMNAFLGMAVAESAKKKGAPAPVHTPVWCQDSAQALQAGIYRADGATDSYLLALADAGRAIWAGPDPGLSLLVQIDDKAKADKPSFLVQLLLLPRTLSSRPYDRLPPPNQALAIVKEGHFASAVPTWGKAKGHIEISSEALK